MFVNQSCFYVHKNNSNDYNDNNDNKNNNNNNNDLCYTFLVGFINKPRFTEFGFTKRAASTATKRVSI